MGANLWLFNLVGATVHTGHEKIWPFKHKDVKVRGHANNIIRQSFCLSGTDNLTGFSHQETKERVKLGVPPQVSAFPGTLNSSHDPAC